MLTITGNTFQHREFLKSIRARFDPARKCWTYPGGEHETALRALSGVTVTGGSRLIELLPKLPIVTWIDDPYSRTDLSPPPIGVRRGDETWIGHFAHKNALAFFGFDSLAEQLEYARNIKPINREGREPDARGWYGSPNWEHAMRMAETGDWSEGIDLASKVIEHFNTIHARKRRRHNSVAGGHVNVGRLLSGNPKHMISRPKQDGRRIVTLFVDVGMSSLIDSQNAIIRAALVGACADLLESNGYSCEIIAASTPSHQDNAAYQMTTKLKRAGERLNLADVIFAFGHPSYLRRIIFSIVASERVTRPVWKTMGRPSPLFNDDNPPGKSELVINKLDVRHQDKLRASDPIERALEMFPFIVPDDFPIEVKL